MPACSSSRRGFSPVAAMAVLFSALIVGGCFGSHGKTSTSPPGSLKSTSPSAFAAKPAGQLEPMRHLDPRTVKKYFIMGDNKMGDNKIISYTRPGPFAGNFFVDPASGKLAWKAMICTAPDCPGRKNGKPTLFGIRHANLYPLPDGTTPNLLSDGKGPQVCPFCGRYSTIIEYLAPTDQEKIVRLRAELEQAYVAYRDAKAAGRDTPETGRTPGDILQEMNAIPRTYLLDKDAVYPEHPEPQPLPEGPSSPGKFPE